MAVRALAKMKGGKEGLGEALLSKGTCMYRGMTARKSIAVQGTANVQCV